GDSANDLDNARRPPTRCGRRLASRRLPMKEIVFFGGFILCVPVGILLAVVSKRFQGLVFAALVFGTTNTAGLFGQPMDINFISREWYRGTTRGIEITYLDLLTIILL